MQLLAELTAQSLSNLPSVAQQILSLSTNQKVFCFYGEMGAGKTTLIKELCKTLGSNDHFSSPSYAIVNQYSIENSSEKIFHIDLYRLNKIEEAQAIGIEEYTDSGNYCFVEWAGLIEPILPAHFIRINIEAEADSRRFSIFSHQP